MLLHEKIRKVREFKDLSQDYVARRLNISQEAYSNWEKGRPRLTLDKLRAIAEVLEVNPMDIVDLQESSLFKSLHGKGATGSDDLHANELTPGERHLFEQRISELQDGYRWLRQQNEMLTKQLALTISEKGRVGESS